MTTEWTDQGTFDGAGIVGGDAQASDSFVRVLRKVNPNNTLAEIASYYYAFEDDNGTFGVENQIVYTVFTDPDDVGGSELWSEVEYDTYYQIFDLVEAAAAKALLMAETEPVEAYLWDGMSR